MTATILPTTPRRTYGWRSWRDAAFEFFLGALLGTLVTLIESGGKGVPPDAYTVLRNIILAGCVTLFSRGAETTLSWAIEQSKIPTTFRVVIYTVGGLLGWLFGLVVVATVLHSGDDDFQFHGYHFIYTIITVTVLSLLIGLILHHNRKRNDRLMASLARLKEHEFAEKELEIARAMQRRLLPPPVVERDGWRVTARTEAAHIVGGDFYDVVRIDEGVEAILAADVAGKGIAASLIMASCKAMIPFLAGRGDAATVMMELNRSLCEQLNRREFVAMVFVRFEPATGALEIVNAGMPDPLLVSNGIIRPLTFTGDRLPLGAMRASRYVATRATLGSGERLVLFSDGLPEASVDGEHLGYERVEEMVRTLGSVDAVVAEVQRIATIEDDLTVVVIER